MLQQSYFLVFTMLMLFHAKNAVTDLWFSIKNLFYCAFNEERWNICQCYFLNFFFFQYLHSEANPFCLPGYFQVHEEKKMYLLVLSKHGCKT